MKNSNSSSSLIPVDDGIEATSKQKKKASKISTSSSSLMSEGTLNAEEKEEKLVDAAKEQDHIIVGLEVLSEADKKVAPFASEEGSVSLNDSDQESNPKKKSKSSKKKKKKDGEGAPIKKRRSRSASTSAKNRLASSKTIKKTRSKDDDDAAFPIVKNGMSKLSSEKVKEQPLRTHLADNECPQSDATIQPSWFLPTVDGSNHEIDRSKSTMSGLHGEPQVVVGHATATTSFHIHADENATSKQGVVTLPAADHGTTNQTNLLEIAPPHLAQDRSDTNIVPQLAPPEQPRIQQKTPVATDTAIATELSPVKQKKMEKLSLAPFPEEVGAASTTVTTTKELSTVKRKSDPKKKDAKTAKKSKKYPTISFESSTASLASTNTSVSSVTLDVAERDPHRVATRIKALKNRRSIADATCNQQQHLFLRRSNLMAYTVAT